MNGCSRQVIIEFIAFCERPCNGREQRRIPWRYCAVLGVRLLVPGLNIAEE
jgi:hypothetical protein